MIAPLSDSILGPIMDRLTKIKQINPKQPNSMALVVE